MTSFMDDPYNIKDLNKEFKYACMSVVKFKRKTGSVKQKKILQNNEI